MGVFTVTSPDIVQFTGASSSSLTVLTSVMSVALGRLCVKPLESSIQKQMTMTVMYSSVLMMYC